MKNIMMETAQVTCGLSKGPCTHKETVEWGGCWSSKGKEVWKLEDRKLNRDME